VEIFILANEPLSAEARFCIFCKALSQAIIFSFQTNFALHSSALYSLCLENHITTNDAKIQNNISNIIDVKKYAKVENSSFTVLETIFQITLAKNITKVFSIHCNKVIVTISQLRI
jgi:hypothetical protein